MGVSERVGWVRMWVFGGWFRMGVDAVVGVGVRLRRTVQGKGTDVGRGAGRGSCIERVRSRIQTAAHK